MNERIKQLATQAANYANTYDDAGADIWFEMYNQKFAELIVRECADIADTAEPFLSSDLIKKHFGVDYE